MNYNRDIRETINREILGYNLQSFKPRIIFDENNPAKSEESEEENQIDYDYIFENGGIICPGAEWNDSSMNTKSTADKGLCLRLRNNILNLN